MNKTLMIVYSHFPDDERLRREAEALVEAGYGVSVLCLKYANERKQEKIFGVNVFRLNMTSSRSSKSRYIFLYISFFLRSFFKINWLYIKHRYDVLHVHNMPDFLVFLGLIPKVFGAKIILDMHDPSPEIFMTKFNEGKDTFFIKLLKWQEKVSIKFSDSIITTNKSFLERFISRGCLPEKINIVMNTPQESVFDKKVQSCRKKFKEDQFIIMYHGSIVERHGLDILARAIKILEKKIRNLLVIVFGDGEFVPKFLEEVNRLQLNDVIKYYGKVSLEEIAETIPEIDVGVIPNRVNPFTQINLPVRTFEYLCMKKTVVVPRTQGIKDYFDEDSIFYFNAGDDADLANVIFDIFSNPSKKDKVINNGFGVYLKYRWETQSKNLIQVYNQILT